MNPIRHSLWMGDDDTMKLGDKVKDSNDNVCGSPVDIYSNLYDDLGEVEKDNSFIENNNSADKGPAGYDNTGPALVQMNHEATQHATCSYPLEVKSSSRPGSSASSPRRSESRPHRHRSRSREPRSRRSRSREHRRSSRRSRSRDRRHHRSRDYRRRSRSRDRRRSRSRDRRRRHDRSPDRYRHRGWNSGYPQQAENYAWTWNPPADGELSIQTICTSRGHYRRPLVSREQVDPSVYSIAGAPVPPAETTPLTEQELGQMLIQQHSLEPHGAGAMWAGTGLAPPGIGEIAPPSTGDATVPEASAPPNAPPSGASVSVGATASVTAGSVPPNGPGWAHYGYPGASQHKDKESRSQHEERQRSRDRDYDRHRSSRRDSDRRHSHHHQRSRSRDRGRHGDYRHGDSRSRDHSRERSERTSQPKRSSNDRDKENDPSAPDDEESETKKPAKVDHKRRSSAGSDSRAPAGYCFVEFPTEEDGRKAMLRLSGKVIPNSKPPKLFKLNLASFGRDNDDTEYSLFIGDLTEEVDDLMLYTAFESKYKSVKMAKVVIDSSGVSRGYGFVRFGEEKEMKSALIHMQRYPHLGRKPIKVSLATPKSKRNPSSTYNSNNTSTSSTTNTSAATYNYSGYYNQNTAASTTTPAATDAATAAYNQQYYQSQQAAWWQAYQMPPGSAGGYYGGYPSDYNYDQTATTEQPQPTQPQAEAAADESEELEDPGFDIDVAKMNEAYMERSEELYTALEESRWQPIDNLMCAPSAAAVKS